MFDVNDKFIEYDSELKCCSCKLIIWMDMPTLKNANFPFRTSVVCAAFIMCCILDILVLYL